MAKSKKVVKAPASHVKYYTLWPTMPDFPYDVVGISGHMRSGKDTIADILCQRYGYHKVLIAAPLHQMWSICHNTSGSGCKDRSLRMIHSLLEDVCQKIGSPIPYDHLAELTHNVYGTYEAATIMWPQITGTSVNVNAKRYFLQAMSEVLDTAYLGRPGIRAYTLWRIRHSLMQQQSIRENLLDMEQGDTPPLAAVVVPDIRFSEEATDILNLQSGKVFFLKLAPALLRERLKGAGLEEEMKEHLTEKAIDSVKDVPGVETIDIKKDLLDLPDEITSFLQQIHRGETEAYEGLEMDKFGSW